MLDDGEGHVLTRHRRIAEVACGVMREDGYDVDRWYAFLARAALLFYGRKLVRDPNLEDWNPGLVEHFVSKGERWWPVGIAIAKAVHDVEPEKNKGVITYSLVLRRTGRTAEAMNVLMATGERFRRDRGVLYEWSSVAGALADHGLAIWLCGRALADGTDLTLQNCKLILPGMRRSAGRA